MTKAKAKKEWLLVLESMQLSKLSSINVPRHLVTHPREAGARATATLSCNQFADYALELRPGSPPLLVREYEEHYQAFSAGAQMAALVAQLVEQQPKAAAYLSGALFGAMMAGALSSRRDSSLLGAGLGMLLVAALESSGERQA